jgi:hypothetical protein
MWDGRDKVVECKWSALFSDVNHKVVGLMDLEVTLKNKMAGECWPQMMEGAERTAFTEEKSQPSSLCSSATWYR